MRRDIGDPPNNRFVGQGPCALPWSDGRATARVAPTEGYKRYGEVRYPPVTSLLCQPPLGKGAEGTGDGLRTSDIGHWFAMTGSFTWSAVGRADVGIDPYGSVSCGA